MNAKVGREGLNCTFPQKPSNRTGSLSGVPDSGWRTSLCTPYLRPPPPRWEAGPHPSLPRMQSRGVLVRGTQTSLQARWVMERVGPILLPLSPLLVEQPKSYELRRRKPPRPQSLALGVVQWGTRSPPVYPTPLTHALRWGVGPISPRPPPLEVEKVGVGPGWGRVGCVSP